jgi:hypothetical protein
LLEKIEKDTLDQFVSKPLTGLLEGMLKNILPGGGASTIGLGGLFNWGAPAAPGGSPGGLSGIGSWFSSLFGGATATANAPAVMGGLYHSGGDVGFGGVPIMAPASLFAGARRFHSGLAPGEFPSILQHGERVLTQAQAQRSDAVISGLAEAAGASRAGSEGPRELHTHLHVHTPDVASFQASRSQVAAMLSNAAQRGARNQ